MTRNPAEFYCCQREEETQEDAATNIPDDSELIYCNNFIFS